MLGVVFAESLITVADTMRLKERMYNLSYSEFVYFLCRITYAHYENTSYESEEFFVKLDNLLEVILDPFDLHPQFSYGAKFVYNQRDRQQEDW